MRVNVVSRNGIAMIPQGDFVIELSDHLYIDIVRDCLDDLTEYLGVEE